MRKAKIVCTLGPASSSPERLSELVAAGMDVARLNMSHGDYADHERNLRSVREAAEAAGRPVGVLADLQGPKIRLGRFTSGKEKLLVGATFAITVENIEGTVERCSTTYKGLCGDVRAGDLILIDDGRIALRATEVTEHRRDHRGSGRRTGQQQQGNQPARRRRERPGDEREGHRGPALGAAQWR